MGRTCEGSRAASRPALFTMSSPGKIGAVGTKHVADQRGMTGLDRDDRTGNREKQGIAEELTGAVVGGHAEILKGARRPEHARAGC